MTQKYRFHALGIAHTITSKQYTACAFTMKVLKFCRMMHERGHTVFYYGHELSDVPCTEHIVTLTDATFRKVYGDYDYKTKFFKYDLSDEAYRTFDAVCIGEIQKRKERGDFLLCFWGAGHRRIADAHSHDMLVVEPGIGYPLNAGHFARWRVYESYAILNAINGHTHVAECKEDWYHVVIPNYFDPDDFDYRKEKGDYFLYLGRIYSGKGVHIAVQVCKKLGLHLKLAGQGNPEELGGYDKNDPSIEYVGYANWEKRKELLAGARGLFLPSQYCEPFGGTSIEALFSGTPIITTDWGAFSENNIHGVTGYRCRTMDQFMWAVNNIDKIDSEKCREFAMKNFSLQKVAIMYEEYFQMIHDVQFKKGWYEEHPDRENLDWLRREIP